MINLLFLCLLFSGSGQENPDHVVVISIDGLRPEFYRGKNYELRTQNYGSIIYNS